MWIDLDWWDWAYQAARLSIVDMEPGAWWDWFIVATERVLEDAS